MKDQGDYEPDKDLQAQKIKASAGDFQVSVIEQMHQEEGQEEQGEVG